MSYHPSLPPPPHGINLDSSVTEGVGVLLGGGRQDRRGWFRRGGVCEDRETERERGVCEGRERETEREVVGLAYSQSASLFAIPDDIIPSQPPFVRAPHRR